MEGLWRIIRIVGSLLYRRLLKYLDLFPCKTKAEREWESSALEGKHNKKVNELYKLKESIDTKQNVKL